MSKTLSKTLSWRSLANLLPIVGLLLITSGLYAQNPGCSAPPCSPNPVPCAHCAGTWTDNYGGTWTVTSNTTPPSSGTYSVSGTLRVPSPVPGCPTVTWSVSGTLSQTFGSASQRGTTAAHWVASNPSPSSQCGNWIPFSSTTFDGNILNDGCDFSSGTWSNSDGASGSFSMTKPTDFPNLNPAETSTVVAWWSSAPTVALFEQNIGSSTYLAGQQVYEASNGSPTDTCWFSGSIYAPGALSGGGWFVGFYFFNNRWHYDYIGMLPQTVSYYRSNNRPPCLITIPQAMRMYARDTLSSSVYFTNTLYINLPDHTNYGVARAGVQAWRTWP
jgi:hypothetical protein